MGHQVFQQLSHAELLLEVFTDLHRFFEADPRDLRQPLRGLLHHREGLVSEFFDDAGGCFRSDAPDRPGGQIFLDLHGAVRHQPLQELRPELLTMGGMGLPVTGNHQPLPQGTHGDRSHHGDRLLVLRGEADHGVAVRFILV